MTQIPWRHPVEQHPGEAIGSLVIRLAPRGLLTPGEFLKYHFNRDARLAPTDIATDREALKDLAVIGSFDIEQLYRASWRTVGNLTEFLGRMLPQGWFKPEVRRLAPGVMKSDGDDPWIRNDWQIRGIPCDCDTGEIIIERCVNCHNALTWTGVHNVYSCAFCASDQRCVAPRYAPADLLAKSRELRAYLRGQVANLPAELSALDDHEFLSLICWLPYFVSIPHFVRVRPSPHEAAEGFALAKQWPMSFDKAIDELMIRYGEEAVVAVGRVGSPAAYAVLETRLLTRLRLPRRFDEQNSGFTEPVADFGVINSSSALRRLSRLYGPSNRAIGGVRRHYPRGHRS